MTEISGPRRLLVAARLLFGEPELRVLFVCMVLLGLGNSCVLPFMSMFGTLEVGMSLTTFGAFMTASMVSNILISSVLSRWSDGLPSRRVVLLLGAGAGCVGYVGYAFVRSPWLLLLVAALILGVASLTFSQLFAHTRERLESSRASPSETPLYMNAFRMAYAAAWTLGPALAALTLTAFGFRGLYLGAAFFYLLLFLLLFLFVPDTQRVPAEPLEAGARLLLWTLPGVLPWFVAFIFIFAAQSISMSNMSLYVLHDLGGTEANVGLIFSLAPIFEVPLMLYLGLLATRFESGQLIRAAMALSVVYFGGLVLVREPWQIYPLQALSAAIVAVTSGVAITFFQNKLPDQMGSATNLYVNAIRIGSTSGYLTFGTLAAGYGHRGAYVACTALSVCALLSTTLLVRARSRLHTDAAADG